MGQVAYSKAGRDTKKVMIVVGVIDSTFVLMSDGDLRRVEKPKKKRIKHLEITNRVLEPISEKLRNGQKVSNSEIRAALAEFKQD